MGWPATTPNRSRGFTLPELMVVIAIIGILALMIGVSMTREDNSRAVDLLAQRVLVLMRQARTTALDSGAVTRVRYVATTALVVEQATNRGIGGLDTGCTELPCPPCATNPSTPCPASSPIPPATPANQWILLAREVIEGGATVHTITATSDMTANGSSTSLTDAARIISFSPDGSSNARTAYVRDAGNVYHSKVVLYGTTGFSQIVSRW